MELIVGFIGVVAIVVLLSNNRETQLRKRDQEPKEIERKAQGCVTILLVLAIAATFLLLSSLGFTAHP